VEAEIKEITTFSFQIELGIYFVDIPPEGHGPREKSGRLLPKDYQCHVRLGLQKPAEHPKPSMPFLWYIDPDGVNLEEVVNSVRYTLERDALPWFDRFSDRESFFELLLADVEHGDEVGWGFGAPDSQNRNYMVGYLAKSLGHNEMAIACLEAYLESAKEHGKLGLGAYNLIHERVESDIAIMRSQLGRG
jgi:hypothetical protein